MSEKVLPIIGLKVGGIPENVLVCGDPARARKIAAFLEGAALIAQNREYHAYAGVYEGLPVLVCSHGIGAPGAAMGLEELIAAGAKRIIRVGTCGGMQRSIKDGDLVIATAAVANIGFAREFLPPHYPAVATPEVVLALRDTAVATSWPHHNGIVLTRDLFFGGVEPYASPDYQKLAQAHVLAVEMECAALFMIGSLRGIQTGAILAVDGNVLEALEDLEHYNPHRELVHQAVDTEIRIALEALRRLA
jgi:uridine phosphorylase